jgi:hypothetical protein
LKREKQGGKERENELQTKILEKKKPSWGFSLLVEHLLACIMSSVGFQVLKEEK